MNWYKKAQLNKESSIGKAFLGLTVPAIALMLGLSLFDVENKMKENPQGLKQQIEQKQVEPQVEPQQQESPIVQSENIDLNKIYQIESSGGKDLWNERTRARGHFQFVEKTWNEMVQRLGKNWDWWNDSMDYNKSRIVADFYLNNRIPQMLNYYKIPDTIETRIGAYNWGIGYVKKTWEKYGEEWLSYSPSETQEYVRKYK